MDRYRKYLISFLFAPVLWLMFWILFIPKLRFAHSVDMAILIVGLGLIVFYIFKSYTSNIKSTLQGFAEKFDGRVEKYFFFSSPEVFFNYKQLPGTLSYEHGGKYSPPETIFKIQANFPKNIKLEIGSEFMKGTLKTLGLDNPDIEIGDKDFDKKFKLELKGRNKDFLEQFLTQKVKSGFMYFFKKGKYPELKVDDGDLIFTFYDLPLDPLALEDYYSFAFYVFDHIEGLLENKKNLPQVK